MEANVIRFQRRSEPLSWRQTSPYDLLAYNPHSHAHYTGTHRHAPARTVTITERGLPHAGSCRRVDLQRAGRHETGMQHHYCGVEGRVARSHAVSVWNRNTLTNRNSELTSVLYERLMKTLVAFSFATWEGHTSVSRSWHVRRDILHSRRHSSGSSLTH
jgi:hypothetical protein